MVISRPQPPEAPLTRPTYATARWLVLRLLGVVYLFAFWSLAQQVIGLIGHDGILPAAEYMASVREFADASGIGVDRYRLVPTLCWFGTSDLFLQTLPLVGVALAALLIAGIAPIVILPLLWLLFLSLTIVSRDFLSFQWDALLLESGLLTIGLAPFRWRDRRRDAIDPPPLARWLIWWLLFRLMLGSGIVKLASGDPTWRNLTALAVHYETQPLPTPVAWYAAQLPLWVHQASTAFVFAVEIVGPWLIFARLTRTLAAVAFIALQSIIALTGNYAFFNLLTMTLCVMLLDDRTLRVVGRRETSGDVVNSANPAWVPLVLALVTVPVSGAMLAAQLGLGTPPIARPLLGAIDPLRSVNPYGLFAVMTTTRPEIIVEGSVDGTTWRAYEFRDKPGAVTRQLPWVAPFQPRLDWQMWFAALGRYEEEPWFWSFSRRLLEGSPAVLRLLDRDPFDGKPPRFVRATLYQYRFSDRATHRATGVWWRRERVRDYSPVLSLDTLTGPTR